MIHNIVLGVGSMIIEVILVILVLALCIFVFYKKYGLNNQNFLKSALILSIAAVSGIFLFKYTGISGLPFIILAVVTINLISR